MPSVAKAKIPLRKVGLARAISKLGYCSRSRAAELIRAGRVSLNGKIQCDSQAPVDLGKDRIQIDGHSRRAEPKTYLMLNKPRGLVTTASDEKDRQTVYSCLDPQLPWLAPVGRLDKASEGLLLLTNDSEWSARVLAPETHLEKTYHVQISAMANEETINSLLRGVRSESEILRVRQARVLRRGVRNCWIEILLDEGRNRHIRRMLSGLGFEVLRLVRVAIGPLALGELAKGSYRSLSYEEKRQLDQWLVGLRGSARRHQQKAIG